VPARLLQACDRETVLPDGASVPTAVLQYQAAVLRYLLPEFVLCSGSQSLLPGAGREQLLPGSRREQLLPGSGGLLPGACLCRSLCE
jgi:hypothetical protein